MPKRSNQWAHRFESLHAAIDADESPACSLDDLRRRLERIRAEGWATKRELARAEAELEEAEAAAGIRHLKQGVLL